MNEKIPKFKSEEAEIRFWDKNSPLDYPDELVEEKKPFKFDNSLFKKAAHKQRERKTSLTFRMEESQILLAKIIAKRRGDHYQTLMRRWVRERIIRELKENPEIEKEIYGQKAHSLHK